MTVNWIATLLVVPPLNLALFALLALLVLRHRARLAVVGAMVAGLLVLSLPVVGNSLLAALEQVPEPPADPAAAPPGAIVVLGAEIRRVQSPTPGAAASAGADEVGEDADIGPLSLERVRAAAALHRRTGLPILVSGGTVGDDPAPIAAVMARSLADDFNVPPLWVEARSRDTWENARFSAELLRAAGISRVYVVTHAWHMPRALLAFRRAGIEAVPVPVRRDAWPPLDVWQFLPSEAGWQTSYFGFHEWIGLAFYSVR